MLAALLTSAALAAAGPVCHGQLAPKPPDPNAALKDYARQRAEFGFRHDLAYVKRLVERGVWEYDVGYIPVTPAENRYLKLRDELDLGAKGYRYLREHRDVAGVVSVQDDWPHQPYLFVGFTRDVAQHLRELRALVPRPQNLRSRRVPFSEHQLDQLAKQLFKDAKTLRRAGFEVVDSGVGAFSADADVITKRTDAKAYFRRHYGSGLQVHVIAREETSLTCTAADDFQIAPDGRSITVHWTTGGSARTERVELDQQADHVTVGVVERVFNGPNTADARGAEQTVALSAPLGDRAVIDAATGLRLLQSGPSPGEPACPPPPPPLTRLQAMIEQRADEGLRHDAGYVQAMLTRKDPFTKAERKWLSGREKLEEQTAVDRYLAAHHGESGGWTVAGTFPETPYVLARVTQRPAYHLAQLRKLTKAPLKVVTVAHTLDELYALSDRIQSDAKLAGGFFDGYGDAGFRFLSADVDEDAGTVVVDAITPRADAAAYFQGRYGPLVQVRLRGTRFECPPQPVTP